MNNENKVTIEYKVFKDARSQDMETMNVEVSEEVAIAFDDFRKKEHALEMQDIRNLFTNPYVEGETEILAKLKCFENDCEQEVFKNLELDLLKEKINKLSETQKRRINLYFSEQLSFRQIAELEKVALNAVSKSINSAINSLKK